MPIGEIVGKYYGYATGDFYEQNIRRNYLVTITVRPGTDPDSNSSCNCVIWIDIGDSLGTLATICAGGPSERLESDCRNGEFHDVFLGVADRMRISGELESYHAPRDSSEYRWCTLAFHATRR
ncbi:hypothetical protein C3F09_04895 [candidate division GN15 bacterium]|uniref:Uncharacterized protein n=1 Tax=candidate division GN15 bacterium TaxID=2072418 RepID=A0A855X2A0_9BACT|nr:MAG: hypothetical protein C3F09_04895 [candidate division GN15 bacterium]